MITQSIKELLVTEPKEQMVTVQGWVRNKRGNKQVNFIALNDGSTINNIQIVVDVENFGEEPLKKVTTGAALSVTGMLVPSAGSGQACEVAQIPTLRHFIVHLPLKIMYSHNM